MRIIIYAVVGLLVLGLFVGGCQLTSSHKTLSGNWAATAISSNSSAPNPMLVFTFTMSEGTMSGTGSSGSAPITTSNLAMNTGNNCFDSNATLTGTVSGAMNSSRSLVLTLSEGGNSAVFNLTAADDNNTANGTYSLTGGHTIGSSTTACVASDSGNAAFVRK